MTTRKSTTSGIRDQKIALISVYDKTGIVEFAKKLVKLGWRIVSSGGTAKVLRDAGVPVTDISELTGFPAILGHRVVTLHPQVHGGILANLKVPEHLADMEEYGISPISLVVGGLYPFASEPSIEMIDVGGPAMVRGAAKNHANVGVVTNKDDYPRVIHELESNGGELSDDFREQLAVRAFAHTAGYDLEILRWISGGKYDGVIGRLAQSCRYGENAWQTPAGFFTTDRDDSLALHRFDPVKGSSPSYNNLRDFDRLLQTMTHIVVGHQANLGNTPYAAVVVKHGNACGAAVGDNQLEVVEKTVMSNPIAIHGGIVMTNFVVDTEVARRLLHHGSESKRLLNGVLAPGFTDNAVELLGRKDGKSVLAANPQLGLITRHMLDTSPVLRQVRGGFLLQPNYTYVPQLEYAEYFGDLGTRQLEDLVTAWGIGSTSNSNTITLVKDGQLIGNGVGQVDRVFAAEIAVMLARRSEHDTTGAVAYSDSFFPFPDGPAVLADAGVSAIFATSGSKNDGEVRELCSERGVTLLWLPDTEARGFFGH